jgi:hypothetical protein
MKAKVVSEDMGAQKMVPKHDLFRNISLHIQKLNYEKNIYELEKHVRKEALNLNLLPKLRPVKITPLASFFNDLIKSP